MQKFHDANVLSDEEAKPTVTWPGLLTTGVQFNAAVSIFSVSFKIISENKEKRGK